MRNDEIKVLLIEDNPADARLVQRMLAEAKGASFLLESADLLSRGVERAAKGGIDVILLDLSLPDSQGIETFEKVRAAAPQAAVVLMSSLDDEALALRAVQMGAQDYLVKGDTDCQSLGRALRYAVQRNRKQVNRPAESGATKRAKVIVFLGSKGGVGTTTAALNVVACLAKGNQSVIALELKSACGTFSHQLRHNPIRGLGDLLETEADRIDDGEVSSRLVRLPFGASVLFGPHSAKDSRGIEPRKAEVVIQVLARMTDYLVVDSEGPPSDAARAAVGLANLVVLVVDREPSSVVCGKVVVEQLKQWGLSQGLIGAVIVNRAALPYPMPIAEINAQLGCALLGTVTPAIELCVRANLQGLPLALLEPNSAAGSTLAEIANRVAAENLVTMVG